MFFSIQWLFTVHNCSSKGSPTSLMSEFGIKLPTEAGWDVAGKPHQLVSYTRQPETNKHHLAPFLQGRKMEKEDTQPNPPCFCSFVPKVMAILKCHASVHTVEFHSPPFPHLTLICITQPLVVTFCSLPTADHWPLGTQLVPFSPISSLPPEFLPDSHH